MLDFNIKLFKLYLYLYNCIYHPSVHSLPIQRTTTGALIKAKDLQEFTNNIKCENCEQN